MGVTDLNIRHFTSLSVLKAFLSNQATNDVGYVQACGVDPGSNQWYLMYETRASGGGTPLHINGSVGVSATLFPITGNKVINSATPAVLNTGYVVVSGVSDSFTITNTHATQYLEISFDSQNWFRLAAATGTYSAELNVEFFWARGQGAATTFQSLVTLRQG